MRRIAVIVGHEPSSHYPAGDSQAAQWIAAAALKLAFDERFSDAIRRVEQAQMDGTIDGTRMI